MASATAAGVSATTFSYDTLGRYSGSTQTTFSTVFPFGDATTPGYQWNLADALTAMKAPSGKLYTWTMTSANRQRFAFGGGFGYAQVTAFTPSGEPKSLSFGSGMTETIGRNGLGQVTPVLAQLGTTTLLELTNEYEATTNNGNLKSQTISPLGRKQTFTYDGKNRLESAVEQPVGGGAVSWSQTFGYDDFGNRWVGAFTGALPNGPWWYQIPVGQSLAINNRVKDEAYDAENRLKSAGPSVSFLSWGG
jgi:hypothetical protein